MKTPKIPKHILIGLIASLVFLALIVFAFLNSPLQKGEELYGATITRDYEGMIRALENGADADFLFDSTRSSLEAAIEGGDVKAVAILKKYGASNRVLSGHHERMLNSTSFAKRVQVELDRL